jgi:hypothetical protein
MIVTCYKTLSSFTTGAFNITREAQQKSRMAQSKVDGTQVMLNESMKTRSEVEKMLEDHKDAFNQKIQENEADLNEIDGKVSSTKFPSPFGSGNFSSFDWYFSQT